MFNGVEPISQLQSVVVCGSLWQTRPVLHQFLIRFSSILHPFFISNLSTLHQFFIIISSSVLHQLFMSPSSVLHHFFISSLSVPHQQKNNVTSFAPKARRLTFCTRLSTLDYPSYIFSVSFVFLNSLLFCVISTEQWSGATSICDGIIFIHFHPLLIKGYVLACFRS